MFVLFLIPLLLMLSLLLDVGAALVMRRPYQSASDAAALAAANLVQSGSHHGCSLTDGPPPGTPRPDLIAAVKASVAINLPGYDPNQIVVTCPAADAAGNGYGNSAVRVQLTGATPGFFSQVVGITAFNVNTSGTAINGQFEGGRWSVVELDPYHSTWGSQTNGCDSVLISGGPTIVYEGSMHINSACPASSGGALGTNGNSATVTFQNGAAAYLVGGYSPGPLTLTPAPFTDQRVIPDPLAGLVEPDPTAMTTVQNNKLTINGTDQILSPGVYRGGIQLKSSARAFLKPGIYYIQGGGIALDAQSSMYAVKSTFTLPNPSSVWTDVNWGTTDCPVGQCGVVIFNTSGSGGGSSMGAISIGAGATLKLRPYLSGATGDNIVEPAYNNLLLWQVATPVPTNSYQQPVISLGGGGSVDISGTIYAPSALVQMTGGSGGSSGNATNLTIQFISWDLAIQGNSSFHFFYQSQTFAKPTDYGLAE